MLVKLIHWGIKIVVELKKENIFVRLRSSVFWNIYNCSYRQMPEDPTRDTNAGLMLAHRLQRWPGIKPTFVQRLSYSVVSLTSHRQYRFI